MHQAELWIPGGVGKLRHVHGVNPRLWPSAGNYDEVERWCATLEPNADRGAKGERWWRTQQREMQYAWVTVNGTPATPPHIMHHVGCSLSHFVTWMDARSRNVPYLIVAESDGTPMWFSHFSGFVEDFQYVVAELVQLSGNATEDWDMVMLDKCRHGAEGRPVQTLHRRGRMKSDYHLYNWTGVGLAGATLYLVSDRFLAQVPQMVHDHGLFMVDAYLDERCQDNLKCFSVCATSEPYWG